MRKNWHLCNKQFDNVFQEEFKGISYLMSLSPLFLIKGGRRNGK